MFRKNGKFGNAINVKNFGAIGNGKKDDTEAIRRARNAAVHRNKALYFPAGTYMLHGSVELWSGCEIYGDGGNTVIKKIPAITQSVRIPKNGYTVGQTEFTVTDASAYKVGYDCCVNLDWPNSSEGLYGKIEKIVGNTITVRPYPHQKTPGLKKRTANHFNSYPFKVLFSSSFPVFCTYGFTPTNPPMDYNICNVYIHDITIDGNRQRQQEGTCEEPSTYTLSAINLAELTFKNTPDDPRKLLNPHENIRLENINVYNSPSDGFSIQSSKNVYITNCITENCGFNGIHLGIGTDIVSITGCKLHADYCGYYDCADVGSAVLVGNHFEKCPYGIGGLDQFTNGLVITGNTFRGCSVGVCAGLLPNPAQTSYLNSASNGYGYISRANSGVAISNNAFYGITETDGDGAEITVTRTGVGILTLGGASAIINGNSFHHLDSAVEMGCNKYIRVANNIIRDCNSALMMIEGAEIIQTVCGPKVCDSAFTGNVVQAGAVGTSASIRIQYARNMRVTDNIVIGPDATIETGEDVENVVIENNTITVVT